jgi:hypothetical protein
LEMYLPKIESDGLIAGDDWQSRLCGKMV